MEFIGIDPSQRHTGICVMGPDLKIKDSYDITTEGLAILESGFKVRVELGQLFGKYPDAVYSVEKMMPAAGSGALLFYFQMILLEELATRTTRKLVHPLPIQLKSFMKMLTGTVPTNKTEIVKRAKELSGYTKRMSSHIADAYFLARAAKMAVEGRYEYNLSRLELPLFSWEVIGGK